MANRLLATLKKERKKYKNKITYPVNPCATVDFPKSLKTTYTCMIYEDCQENSFIRVILKLSLPEAEELLLQNCFPLNLLCVKTKKFALIYSVYSFCFLNSNVEVKTVKPRDGKQQ